MKKWPKTKLKFFKRYQYEFEITVEGKFLKNSEVSITDVASILYQFLQNHFPPNITKSNSIIMKNKQKFDTTGKT